MRGIVKRFPGVLALQAVDFDVRRGEVHALCGENGAGKSTLMKCISGVYTRDDGEMHFAGRPVNFTTPRQAQAAGITTIYQELNLIPQLSIAQNIFLGSEMVRGALLDERTMNVRARELLARLHLEVDPRTLIGSLGVGKQQMIEVAKALHHRADLIIMDEPTAALSIQEIDDLFGIIRELQAQGVAIIYISHHLEETFAISDRVTVLRDGRGVGTYPTASLKIDDLIRLMVGRDLSEQYPKEEVSIGEVLLSVEHLTQGERLHDISFTVRAGEIMGIAGLIGAGRTELVRAIFGADPITAGVIRVAGEAVTIRSPRDAIRAGIALLTEDRKGQGLILRMSTRENMTLSVLGKLTRSPFTDQRRESSVTQHYIDKMAIKTPSQTQLVVNLSGGTQQKVVLGKWMATAPKILIFDEPTRGIDVGAKVEIYKLITQLARDGAAILMVSSELLEILGMSDRVLVIREGRAAAIINRADASEETILAYATGGTPAMIGQLM